MDYHWVKNFSILPSVMCLWKWELLSQRVFTFNNWRSCQIFLQKDGAAFYPQSFKNVYLFTLWAETLKHLSLCSNLVINLCLITPSDNLCLMNSEKTQSADVSWCFFPKQIQFGFNHESNTHQKVILLKHCHSSWCLCSLRLVGWGRT